MLSLKGGLVELLVYGSLSATILAIPGALALVALFCGTIWIAGRIGDHIERKRKARS
jgi:hypothetical protein